MDLLQELDHAPKKAADGVVLDFVATKSDVDRAFSGVAPALPTGDILPILKNLWVSVDNTGFWVVASDSSLTMMTKSPTTKVSVQGAVVFPPQRILQIIKSAAGDIHFKVSAKNGKYVAIVSSEKAKWTIPLVNPEGFPDFRDRAKETAQEIDAEGFKAALDNVRKSASVDPMRPYYMVVDVNNSRVRASDGQRFQQIKFSFPFDCQIPIKAAQFISQKIKPDSVVRAGKTETSLLFWVDDVLTVSQKMVSKFPDVDEVLLLPNLSNDQPFSVGREALLAAVKRVRIVADEDTAAVVLSLNKGSVSVQSKDMDDGGTAVETVPAKWDLSPRHVSVNHAYLVDMLSSTKAEICYFRLGKDLITKPSPLLMEDEDAGLLAVLSQIRLDWL